MKLQQTVLTLTAVLLIPGVSFARGGGGGGGGGGHPSSSSGRTLSGSSSMSNSYKPTYNQLNQSTQVTPAPNGNTGITGSGLPNANNSGKVSTTNNSSVIPAANGNTGFTGSGLPNANNSGSTGTGLKFLSSAQLSAANLTKLAGAGASSSGGNTKPTLQQQLKMSPALLAQLEKAAGGASGTTGGSSGATGGSAGGSSSGSGTGKGTGSSAGSSGSSKGKGGKGGSGSSGSCQGQDGSGSGGGLLSNLLGNLLGGGGSDGGGGGSDGGGSSDGGGDSYSSPAPVAQSSGSTSASTPATSNAPANADTTPVAPATTPAPAPASKNVDLELEDVQLADAASTVAGPAYRIKFRNKGTDASGSFTVGIFASLDENLSENAPAATLDIPSMAAGEEKDVTLRLPLAAMQLLGPDKRPTGFRKVLVGLDLAGAVAETDKSNNAAVIDRTALELAAK